MKTITRSELKGLLDDGTPLVLLDVTPGEYYRAAHLPGGRELLRVRGEIPGPR